MYYFFLCRNALCSPSVYLDEKATDGSMTANTPLMNKKIIVQAYEGGLSSLMYCILLIVISTSSKWIIKNGTTIRDISTRDSFINPSIWRWKRMAHKWEKRGCGEKKTDCRYCYDSLSGFVCNFYGDGSGTRTTETQMSWSENQAHFHAALTGPFRDDDPGISTPLWDRLTRGIIGLDRWVMGLKQRNNLLLPAPPLPTHCCQAPITVHNQPLHRHSPPDL